MTDSIDVLLKQAKHAVMIAYEQSFNARMREQSLLPEDQRLPVDGRLSRLTEEDIYIVWFSKTLQNWKALLSTTIPDGKYYEVTYDGNKFLAYVDTYNKAGNIPIPQDKLISSIRLSS